MGRGLSELQHWILDQVDACGTLRYADICAGYYGWTPVRPIDPSHGQYFSPATIGRQEYRRVLVTISRACKRLARRELVTWENGRVNARRRRRSAIG
jgi:hypothetical protein